MRMFKMLNEYDYVVRDRNAIRKVCRAKINMYGHQSLIFE